MNFTERQFELLEASVALSIADIAVQISNVPMQAPQSVMDDLLALSAEYTVLADHIGGRPKDRK